MDLTGIMIAIAIGALGAAISPRPTAADAPHRLPPSADRGQLRAAAQLVENATGMRGFADFAESVAVRESNFKSNAINDSSSEAAAARRLYHNNEERYANSGFPSSWYTFGSGGWFGFLPATAMASREWNARSPRLIFTPIGSSMLLAAFVQRVVAGHFRNLPPSARTWLTIRRFMSSNKRGYDYMEQLPNTASKRERYAKDLERVGLPRSFMHKRVPQGTRRATPSMYDSILRSQAIPSEL